MAKKPKPDIPDQLKVSDFVADPIRWLPDPVNGELKGFTTRTWAEVQRVAELARAKTTFAERLLTTGPPWFARKEEVHRLAVTGVVLDGWRAVADLLGFVVEPASRLDIPLVIVADRQLADLVGDAFVDDAFGYAHSVERLSWAIEHRGDLRSGPTVVKVSKDRPLDQKQREAAGAGDGVVQVIAPAGSGKTAVLIERVQEIVRRREAQPKQILCLTFNKAAKEELAERLPWGFGKVRAATYHGLGCSILIDAGVMPWHMVPRKGGGEKRAFHLGMPKTKDLQKLIAAAQEQTDQQLQKLKVRDVMSRLSDIKLGQLMCPDEYATEVARSDDSLDQIMAAFYPLYEQAQIDAGNSKDFKPAKDEPRRRVDFDDLIFWTVRLLQRDAELRRKWQETYTHVLVDEYQDIEPAQELLVRMLAAPKDRLFCVGDEDQTLYAFRRASVERILDLDQLYPDLQRFSLSCNYRCPPDVVEASRTLIKVNQRRFRDKTIEWDRNHDQKDERTIDLRAVVRPVEGARDIASLLEGKTRKDVAVLARTIDVLRPVAMACVRRGVPVDGPSKLFAPSVALDVLIAHLNVALYPQQATPALVADVARIQHPALGMNDERTIAIADALRAGLTFAEAFVDPAAPEEAGAEDPEAENLSDMGRLFERVAGQERLAEAVRILRDEGGLDDWFRRHALGDGDFDEEEADDDHAFSVDQFALDDLEQAWIEAQEVDDEQSSPATPRERLIKRLVDLAETLNGRSDKEKGIKLRTIHTAKGSEWPLVIVVGCNAGLMPHSRAEKVSLAAAQRGEGSEAERRIAYVAFTRAKQHLQLHYNPNHKSPFFGEAGLQVPEA